jgi:hypothetical protein
MKFVSTLFALGLLLTGCFRAQITNTGVRTKTYIGVTRVAFGHEKGDLTATDVRTLGLGWDAGPWLGWRADNWVSADPAKCQLLVVIRRTVEAATAQSIMQSLEGRNLCVANFSGVQPR